MVMIGATHRIIHWYSKDGIGVLLGKSLATIFTVIALVDSIFGTHYLGITIIASVIALVYIVFGLGTLILKGLDKLGVIELSLEAEVVRKGFGLITGIEDWFEMIISCVFD